MSIVSAMCLPLVREAIAALQDIAAELHDIAGILQDLRDDIHAGAAR